MFPLQLTNTILIDFFTKEDAPFLYEVIDRNRAYLKEFLPWLDSSKTAEDSLAFIRRVTSENEQNIAFTLCIRENTAIIGTLCFHAFNHQTKTAGIGYWLDKSAQGKGIITLASEQLIQYGFNCLKLNQINLSYNIANTKSAAVAERLGFSRKKLLPQNEWLYDHYVDHCCYEITAEEWKSMQIGSVGTSSKLASEDLSQPLFAR